MIRSYKYLCSIHSRLHELMIAFFNTIEFEKGPFHTSFFGYQLGYLAERHPEILKKRCIEIYNSVRDWSLKERTNLFNSIRESNEVENICCGNYQPLIIDRNATGVYKTIRDLFIDLYTKVLDGKAFNDFYSTTLRNHFDEFRKLNNDITVCPLCGIGELKTHLDDIRDQYDHYLAKSIYPLSSVNFKNLIPICRECNSTDVKGEKDIIACSSNKKLFYLFDSGYKGVKIEFQIVADNPDIENISWKIMISNPDKKDDEVQSWKDIYNIDSRYIGYIKSRIEKWYRHYWEFMNDRDIEHLNEADRSSSYFLFMKKDESLKLNFIRKPALVCFLRDSLSAQAVIEARHYSLPVAI